MREVDIQQAKELDFLDKSKFAQLGTLMVNPVVDRCEYRKYKVYPPWMEESGESFALKLQAAFTYPNLMVKLGTLVKIDQWPKQTKEVRKLRQDCKPKEQLKYVYVD